ncbi:uncharacterized protein LOC120156793 isoform X2 [Hibiscus syriacus]|uniref:uncharacterized protein LOC120156793 isoform X2 n=2 Tax=Hibiscus syriacus TaxID=106335 RepID=UPI001924E9B3|nr:uncharacterized protein LOC120156793 isoform X2 [Hibiscus syriacus]
MMMKNSYTFSGFVSYQMVRDAYDVCEVWHPIGAFWCKISSFIKNNNAGRSGFKSLLSVGHSFGKTDRLYMKGPGGCGQVEVTVSGVADQIKQYSCPPSLITPNRGPRLGSLFRKAASSVSVAAKHAYVAATSTSDEKMIPLKCCLMSITLPWEHIAHDLLFKRSPPVNL